MENAKLMNSYVFLRPSSFSPLIKALFSLLLLILLEFFPHVFKKYSLLNSDRELEMPSLGEGYDVVI